VGAAALIAGCCGLGLGLAAPRALAQDASAPRPGDPAERLSIEEMAAMAAARQALADLKIIGLTAPPTQRDYLIAEEVLATSAALMKAAAERAGPGTPDQQTILRLYLEAAQGAGDTETVLKITRQLVQMDPKDSVSVLRLVSASIARLQTADERLAAYDRFLGDAGADLDPAVRSRLALDAALLQRERGDLEGFASRLARASELDPTNKDAASLILAFYSEQGQGEPGGRFDLILNVLWADPFDPDIYGAAVRELLGAGAYRGAARFSGLHQALLSAQGQRPTPADELAFDLALWNAAGPDTLIRDLTGVVERGRAEIVRTRRELEANGRPTDGVPKPDDVRLTFGRERSRVLAAAAAGDRERAATFMAELTETAKRDTEALNDPDRRPPNLTPEGAAQASDDMKAELTWLRLWTGVDVPQAATDLDKLRAGGAIDPDAIARDEAWLALRRGDADAGQRLAALAGADPLCAVGLGVLAEERGDRAAAARLYADVAARVPGDLAGAYARTRYGVLRGEAPVLSEASESLEAKARDVPPWLDRMVRAPRSSVLLDVRPLRPELSVTERTPVRVRLKNTSTIPLALGPDRPLNSRLLFAPTVDVGSFRFPAADLVEVASMERRLRLLPDEELEMIAWPDLTALSWNLEVAGGRPTRVRWRVLQGFELSSERLYEACPHCASVELPAMMRKLPVRADANYEALRYALETGGPRDLAETILSIKLQKCINPQLDPNDTDRLMAVLTRRYDSLSKPAKILVLSLLPQQPNLFQTIRIDQRAAQDTDEDVLACLIAFRVGFRENKPQQQPGEPLVPNRFDDPIFSAPAIEGSSRLARLRDAVVGRLHDGIPTLATNGWTVPAGVFALTNQNLERQARADAADPAKAPAPPEAPRSPTVPVDPRPVPVVP
jgi:murein DD-endopeptidase MepM/ murein hydrolase activator NlpD